MKYQLHYHKVVNKDDNILKDVLENIDHIDENMCINSLQKFRTKILKGLQAKGWSLKVKLSINSKISVTAMKSDTALCFQTGNMSRFYADLLKIQFLYNNNIISKAIYLIPTKKLANIMGSNLANYDRFVEEITLFNKIITVPIFVIGLF